MKLTDTFTGYFVNDDEKITHCYRLYLYYRVVKSKFTSTSNSYGWLVHHFGRDWNLNNYWMDCRVILCEIDMHNPQRAAFGH